MGGSSGGGGATYRPNIGQVLQNNYDPNAPAPYSPMANTTQSFATPQQAGTPRMSQMAGQANVAAMGTIGQAMGYRPPAVGVQSLAQTDLQPYQNPYDQAVVDQTTQDMLRAQQMQQNIQDYQMGQAGAFGGSRHGIAQAEGLRGFYDRLGAQQAQLRQQGFQQAQQAAVGDIGRQYAADVQNQQTGLAATQAQINAAQALQQAGNLGFTQQRTAQQDLMNQGNIQQLMQQQLIDAGKAQFAGYTGAPASTISYLSNALGASTIPQSQTTSKQPGLFDYLQLGASVGSAFAGG